MAFKRMKKHSDSGRVDCGLANVRHNARKFNGLEEVGPAGGRPRVNIVWWAMGFGSGVQPRLPESGGTLDSADISLRPLVESTESRLGSMVPREYHRTLPGFSVLSFNVSDYAGSNQQITELVKGRFD